MRRSEVAYLKAARRGFLATSSRDRPTVVPVCFVIAGDVIYTAIDKKPKGPRLARTSNIASNPQVAFLVDIYDEDWRELSYLLIHGRSELVSDEAEAARARRLLLQKYRQYRSLKLGDAPIIAIHIADSKFWKFGAAERDGDE
ncbi:MAG: pyridoxamine 5'-phosphate oxidase family protein [Thaumarchaeota archaeon]|nr:pyridoxamine 5'-phosphate oxidase family protein [Nitrososphaerota archaeon]